MDQNDQNDNVADPTERVDPDPPHIVEATPVPEYGSYGDTPATTTLPGAATPGAVIAGPGASAPTEAIPVVSPVVTPSITTPVHPPVVPVYRDDDPLGGRSPGWPYLLAFVALLAGGLVGYLIAVAADDDDPPPAAVAPASDTTETLDLLLERTRADGEYVTPSEYPPRDEITEIDSAAAVGEFQTELDELAAAQAADEGAAEEDAVALTEQVEELETALADMTAERDALAEQIGDTDGAVTDQQAALDAANDQIADLEEQLTAAVADLETANANLAEAETARQTAVAERDTAVETVEALNVMPNPTYINGPVTKARSDAAANGWTLIEQPVESTTAAVGTIIDQAPPAESNMIQGSVLYVTVAERP
ncbi:MAG TPA: hypothetical protein VMM60_17595 [Ilumatobacter sp.]|nr:hypothetical protein [Ilumatobacter sp.]